MQTMTQQAFNQDTDRVWQISQTEPLLVIDEQQSCRVVLPFSLYQQLMQLTQSKKQSSLTNAQRIGMTSEQLALVDDDFEFGKIDFFAKPIEL